MEKNWGDTPSATLKHHRDICQRFLSKQRDSMLFSCDFDKKNTIFKLFDRFWCTNFSLSGIMTFC